MPPGALRGVLSVRIRNLSTNGAPTETIPVIEGGFDPVAVAARPNDGLAMVMDLAGGVVTVSYLTVPLRRPPRIVRTAPPKGRTDVALNTRPLIVFSEPIDAQTLSNTTIQLLVEGVALSGTATPVSSDALMAEFRPAVPLAPNTAYELLITTGVRDREGDALESSERIPFTTQAGAAPPTVAYLTLLEPAFVVLPGSRFELSTRVVGDNGQVLTDRMVSFSSSDTSVAALYTLRAGTAPSRTWVHVNRSGTATITASTEGRSASITFPSVEATSDSSALAIESIGLIEFQYPALPGHWFYAPQLRVREPAGRAGVAVVGAKFVIPGIGETQLCTTYRPVAARRTLDVFQEVYGDFELTYYRADGGRATSTQVSGTIYFIQANGRVAYITVTLPVVAGSLPELHSSSQLQNRWSC